MRFSISKLDDYFSSSLYTNAFFLMANTVVASSLGFIFWIVAARFYTPAEIGLAAALISVATLLAVFSNLGFNFGIIKFLPTAGNPNRLVNSCLTISGLASILLSAVFLGFLTFISPGLSFILENTILALSFVVFAFVWTISPMLDHVFIAKLQSRVVLIRNTVFNVLKIPMAVFFAVFLGAFGIFASWGIAMGISAAVILLFFTRKSLPGFFPKPALDKKIIGDMLHFSIGNYLAHLLYVAPSMLLPLMVLNLMGAHINAYFYVAFMIAEILFIIPTAVSQSLFAEGSTNKEVIGKYTRDALKIIYILIIPAIVMVFLLAGKLLLLFGQEYSDNGAQLLRVFAISGVFLGLNLTYFTILRLEKKVKEIIALSGVLALGVLGLSYFLLIDTGGIVAVGYSWLLMQGIISVYAGLAIRSRIRFENG